MMKNLAMTACCTFIFFASQTLALSPQAYERIFTSIEGCHNILDVRNQGGGNPEPYIGVKSEAKFLCVQKLISTQGIASGQILVTVKNANQRVLGGPWVLGLSESQPRCPKCYNFSGDQRVMQWQGDSNLFDSSQPVLVTVLPQTTRTWSITYSVTP